VNLSGILVVSSPGRHAEVLAALRGLPGVGVHQTEADTGRIVVVQEAATVEAEVEGLRRIQTLPGVTLAEMVYHYFEDAPATAPTADGFPVESEAGFSPAPRCEDPT
jgi:nitrate reductase NapD